MKIKISSLLKNLLKEVACIKVEWISHTDPQGQIDISHQW